MDEFRIIVIVAVFFTSIPMIIGLFGYQKLNNSMRLLSILFVIMFLVEAYGLYQTFIFGDNRWIFHFYTPIEFTLLLAVFYKWQSLRVIKRMIILLIIGFITFCIINSAFIDNSVFIWLNGSLLLNTHVSFNYLPIKISDIIYVAVASLTLIRIFIQDKGSITSEPAFWVSAALLLFASSAIVFFVFIELISSQRIVLIWILHNMVNAVANILYAIGLIIAYRKGSRAINEVF